MNHSFNIKLHSVLAVTEQHEIAESYTINKLKRGIPENHRTIILPKEVDRAMWWGILRALTREVHSYPCSRSKII